MAYNTESRKRQAVRRLFWPVTFVVVALLLPLGLGVAVGDDFQEVPRVLARLLPQLHLSRKPFDDALARAAVDLFIDMLDFDHSYFLASDVEKFKSVADQQDDALREGNTSLALEIYDTLKARVSNRVEFVDRILAEGLDVRTQGTYLWKRKKAPWPADEKEWDELWRKKITHEYITRLIAQSLGTNDTYTTEEDEEPAGEDVKSERQLSPEDAIRKNYHQYLTVLNDNEPEWVVEQYLSAFARAYDPHTDYQSKLDAEDFDIGMTLSLQGIGALLTSEDGAAKIERLIPGGPAERDGRLKPGDKIIAVAQGDEEPVDVLHWPLRKTVRLIRGPKGSKVVLTVVRASDPTGGTIEKIDLIRDEVRLEEQAARSEIKELPLANGSTGRFGVIYLPEFYSDSGLGGPKQIQRSSSLDVRRQLEQLKQSNVDGIVLDLRNNGGGLLSEAIETTGLFIESGPVVQVQSRGGVRILTDDDPECVYRGPLVVLVNRQTASGSEILAAALQDYGRAVIVGDRKTHGKGTVQSVSELSRGKPQMGRLKVTTATFHRVNGSSTQLRGVEPDIVIPSVFDALELGEESLPYALPWSRVLPCLYRRQPELDFMLPELKAKSQQRQSRDERYLAYLELVNRLSERQQIQEVSLNLEERIRMAREERRLQEALRKQFEANGGGSRDASVKDIALLEAFYVLADWNEFTRAAESILKAQEPVAGPAL